MYIVFINRTIIKCRTVLTSFSH